jgi:hypothetical protein
MCIVDYELRGVHADTCSARDFLVAARRNRSAFIIGDFHQG